MVQTNTFTYTQRIYVDDDERATPPPPPPPSPHAVHSDATEPSGGDVTKYSQLGLERTTFFSCADLRAFCLVQFGIHLCEHALGAMTKFGG